MHEHLPITLIAYILGVRVVASHVSHGVFTTAAGVLVHSSTPTLVRGLSRLHYHCSRQILDY